MGNFAIWWKINQYCTLKLTSQKAVLLQCTSIEMALFAFYRTWACLWVSFHGRSNGTLITHIACKIMYCQWQIVHACSCCRDYHMTSIRKHDSILNREFKIENLASFAKGDAISSLPVQDLIYKASFSQLKGITVTILRTYLYLYKMNTLPGSFQC